MINFSNFVAEDKDTGNEMDTRKGVINFITSNFYRFINSDDNGDLKSIVMLTAALSILSSDQPNAIQVARRLAQSALQRSSKKIK